MKAKASITVPESLLKEVDELIDCSGDRSVFIEEAIKEYIKRNRKNIRNRTDLILIDKNADELNAEAEDILSYQIDG
jgi:metal-responsive CopG/Arc/MetJ family transcriptional regulator